MPMVAHTLTQLGFHVVYASILPVKQAHLPWVFPPLMLFIQTGMIFIVNTAEAVAAITINIKVIE